MYIYIDIDIYICMIPPVPGCGGSFDPPSRHT